MMMARGATRLGAGYICRMVWYAAHGRKGNSYESEEKDACRQKAWPEGFVRFTAAQEKYRDHLYCIGNYGGDAGRQFSEPVCPKQNL